MWEVCSCILSTTTTRQASPPVGVLPQIDPGGANLAQKGFQTTWWVNSKFAHLFLTVFDRDEISWAASAKDNNPTAIKKALTLVKSRANTRIDSVHKSFPIWGSRACWQLIAVCWAGSGPSAHCQGQGQSVQKSPIFFLGPAPPNPRVVKQAVVKQNN